MPLLGTRPAKPLRVSYWNGEDPLEETERRVAAICQHYGITENDLGGRPFIDSGRETPLGASWFRWTWRTATEPTRAIGSGL